MKIKIFLEQKSQKHIRSDRTMRALDKSTL